jgi:hypothetical protein
VSDSATRRLPQLRPPQFAPPPVPPRDFEAPAGKRLDWLHRRVGQIDLYFVSNQEPRAIEARVLFRAVGEAEIWRTDDGRIERGSADRFADGRSAVQVPLGPMESIFVVFRERSTAPWPRRSVDAGEQLLAGPWTVLFPPGSGAPDEIKLPELISWAKHENPEIRHFSGTATYRLTFDVPADRLGSAKVARLDLGDVQVMAEVKLNGKDLGLLWKPPYRIDVGDVLRAGENELEVRVTNLWVNRLIGDEAYPPDASYITKSAGGEAIEAIPPWQLNDQPKPQTKRKTFATYRHNKAGDALLPSGLIGPVRLVFGSQRSM